MVEHQQFSSSQQETNITASGTADNATTDGADVIFNIVNVMTQSLWCI